MEKHEIIALFEEAMGEALNEEAIDKLIDKGLMKKLEALPKDKVAAGDPPDGQEPEVGFGAWLRDMAAISAGGQHPFFGAPRFLTSKDLVMVNMRAADVPQFKDLYEGSPTAGGYLVPTEESREIINLVNNYSVMQQLTRQIPMTSHQITFPTLAGGLTAYWVPEATSTAGKTVDDSDQAGGEKPRSDLTLGQMTIVAHVCAVKVVVSNQLIMDSDPAIDQVLKGLFSETIGGALDVAILRGAGTALDPITGLANLITTNVLAAGPVFGWEDVLDLIHAVIENSPNAQEYPVVGHSKAEKVLMMLKDNEGQFLYKGPNQTGGMPTVWGEPYHRNGNILTNLGAGSDETRLFSGDFANHAFTGMRMGLVIKTNPWSNPEFSYNQTAFLAEVRVGFNVSQEARFAMLSGVPTR